MCIRDRFDIAAYGMRPFFEENELEYDEECILRREVQASGKSRVVYIMFFDMHFCLYGVMKQCDSERKGLGK